MHYFDKFETVKTKLIEPRIVKKINPDFGEMVDKINLKNNTIQSAFERDIKQIEETYDVNLFDYVHYPKKDPIPEEYYVESVESDFYELNIYCNERDDIYKSFHESGLLEEYFPEWYRKGLLSPNENF